MNQTQITFYLMGLRYGFSLKQMMKFVNENQFWSLDQIHDYQSKMFKEMVKHSYEHTTYYRKLMDGMGMHPSDIKSIDDIKKFPILKKEQVLADYQGFTADNFSSYHPMERSTGGTTGVPFKYYNDAKAWGLIHATKIRTFNWGGYDFGSDRIVMMKGGSMYNRGRFGLRTKLWRALQLNYDIHIMHLTDADLELHLANIRKYKIRFMRGYPSAIYVFARFLAKKGIQVPMKGVFTTAEMLHDYQRSQIEAIFGCKVTDAYGCGEGTASANQCEVNDGYHTCIETCKFEVVDSAGNDAAPGAEGEVVITSLCSYCMPFIRYAPGDMAINGSKECSCGRKLPRLDRIIGRSSDLIELPNGRYINGLSMPFEALYDILDKFQLVQEEEDLMVLNIVAKDSYSAKDEQNIMEVLKHNLGEGIRIQVNKVDSIPQTVAGKFRYVISKVKK